jgi:hypothetical protein
MWGTSQFNRRNIVLVALTASTAALALAGPVQAQEAANTVPSQAASVEMVQTRVLKLKDPDGNAPEEVAIRCLRTATPAGRKCIVKVQYPELECTDASVMTSLRHSATGTKPVITGLKLRCIRTVDLQDDATDEDTTTAPATTAPAQPVPAGPTAEELRRQQLEEELAAEARSGERRQAELGTAPA